MSNRHRRRQSQCVKLRYPDAASARIAAAQVEAIHGRRMRPYHCSACHQYHLSSKRTEITR